MEGWKNGRVEEWKGGQEYCLNQDYQERQERQDKIRGFLLFVPHSVRLRYLSEPGFTGGTGKTG